MRSGDSVDAHPELTVQSILPGSTPEEKLGSSRGKIRRSLLLN
jgi:hypothetical protein